MPGTFKTIMVDVILAMARARRIVTLPMAIYVDDICIMGPDGQWVTLEMRAFQEFCAN